MNIYLLAPRNLDHPDWRASTHTGDVRIRAASEDDARNRATLGFGKAVEKGGRFADTISNPWSQPDLVACTIIETYVDGPEEILSPDWAEHDIRS